MFCRQIRAFENILRDMLRPCGLLMASAAVPQAIGRCGRLAPRLEVKPNTPTPKLQDRIQQREHCSGRRSNFRLPSSIQNFGLLRINLAEDAKSVSLRADIACTVRGGVQDRPSPDCCLRSVTQSLRALRESDAII